MKKIFLDEIISFDSEDKIYIEHNNIKIVILTFSLEHMYEM